MSRPATLIDRAFIAKRLYLKLLNITEELHKLDLDFEPNDVSLQTLLTIIREIEDHHHYYGS